MKFFRRMMTAALLTVCTAGFAYSQEDGYGTNSGKLLWTYQAGKRILSGPVVSDGQAYFGCMDGRFYCVNAISGMEKWTYDAGGTVTASPSLYRDTVIAATTGGDSLIRDTLTGTLDTLTGERRVTIDFKQVYARPLVYGDRLYIVRQYYGVECLTASTGRRVWIYTSRNNPTYSAPTAGDGRIYAVVNPDGRGAVLALDADTGKYLWGLKFSGFIRSSPFYTNGRVYVGCDDHYFYCLDASTGRVAWKFRGRNMFRSSPVIYRNRAYVGCSDGKLYCLNVRFGWKLWSFETGGAITSGPVVSDGRVYFGSRDHIFYCLGTGRLRNRLLWKFEAGDEIDSTACISGGKIYFGCNDGKLYCLDAGKPGLEGEVYPSVSGMSCLNVMSSGAPAAGRAVSQDEPEEASPGRVR